MTKASTTRCALYLRVSTEQQAAGNSLATQESQLLRHAKARGYTVADIYADAGLSGKDTNRPELQRLLDDARRRCFDVVLVWAVDRISRSVPDLLRLIDTFREHGVEFAAVSQQFDTSDPAGLLTLHILGSFAQFEREMLVERIKDAHLQLLHRGDWSCGPTPFGYRKADGQLVEVPEEAALVRRMFQLYLQTKSFRAVAIRLNEDGLRTRKGNPWNSRVVGGILINPLYTGANVYGRHAKGDTRLKPKEHWIVVPGMREPMVSPETFQAVQAIADAKKPAKRTPAGGPWLLTGLVRCGKCRSPMYASREQRRDRVLRYYECNGKTRLGTGFCNARNVRADWLEETVLEKLAEVAAHSVPPSSAQQAEEPTDTAQDERRRLQNALDRLKYRIARVFELYETGELDKAAFSERMSRLAGEREEVQAQLAASRAAGPTEACGQRPAVGCESPGGAGTREFLRAVIREVVVNGRSVELVLADLGNQTTMRFTLSVLPAIDTTTLGGRLKKARLEAALEQRDVARLLGVHVQCISNWENGRTRPRRLTIEEIEAAIAQQQARRA